MDVISFVVVGAVVAVLLGVLALLFREKETSYDKLKEESEKDFDEDASKPKSKRRFVSFRDRRAKKQKGESGSGDEIEQAPPSKPEPVKVVPEKTAPAEPAKKPAASATSGSKVAASQPAPAPASAEPKAKQTAQAKKPDVAKPKSSPKGQTVVDGAAASVAAVSNVLKPEEKKAPSSGGSSPKASSSPRGNSKAKSQPSAKASSSQAASKTKQKSDAAAKTSALRHSIEDTELSKEDCDQLISVLQQKQSLFSEWSTKKGGKSVETTASLKKQCEALAAELEDERRSNRENLQAIASRRQEMIDEMRKTKQRFESGQKALAQKEVEVQMNVQRIRQLEKDLDQKSQDTTASSVDTQLAKENATLKNDLSALKAQIKTLEAAKSVQASTTTTAAPKQNAELEAKCSRLEQECSDLRQKLKSQPSAAPAQTSIVDLDSVKFEQKVWEGKVKAIEKEKQSLAHQLAALEREIKSSDTAELQSRCAAAEERERQAVSILETTGDVLPRVQEQLASKEGELKNAQQELAKERQAARDAQTREQQALAKIKDLQAQAEEHSKRIRDLEQNSSSEGALQDKTTSPSLQPTESAPTTSDTEV